MDRLKGDTALCRRIHAQILLSLSVITTLFPVFIDVYTGLYWRQL